MNPIENVWGLIASDTFIGYTQYFTFRELNPSIMGTCEIICQSTLSVLGVKICHSGSEGKNYNHKFAKNNTFLIKTIEYDSVFLITEFYSRFLFEKSNILLNFTQVIRQVHKINTI